MSADKKNILIFCPLKFKSIKEVLYENNIVSTVYENVKIDLNVEFKEAKLFMKSFNSTPFSYFNNVETYNTTGQTCLFNFSNNCMKTDFSFSGSNAYPLNKESVFDDLKHSHNYFEIQKRVMCKHLYNKLGLGKETDYDPDMLICNEQELKNNNLQKQLDKTLNIPIVKSNIVNQLLSKLDKDEKSVLFEKVRSSEQSSAQNLEINFLDFVSSYNIQIVFYIEHIVNFNGLLTHKDIMDLTSDHTDLTLESTDWKSKGSSIFQVYAPKSDTTDITIYIDEIEETVCEFCVIPHKQQIAIELKSGEFLSQIASSGIKAEDWKYSLTLQESWRKKSFNDSHWERLPNSFVSNDKKSIRYVRSMSEQSEWINGLFGSTLYLRYSPNYDEFSTKFINAIYVKIE